MFINQAIQFQVSMTRIQKFLAVDEINKSALNRIDKRVTDDFVKLDHATFHWGIKPEEEPKPEPKKGKKDKKKDKKDAKDRNQLAVENKKTNLNDSNRTSQTTQNRASTLSVGGNINKSDLNQSLLTDSNRGTTMLSQSTLEKVKELQKFD